MSFVTPVNLDSLGLLDRTRLTLEVLGTYAHVRWVMRDDDASRAVQRLRGAAAGNPTRSVTEDTQQLAAWRLGKIVTRVLRVLPSDSRCLFKSLTLMCMLERRGIAHTVVIAVISNPFAAHAWVEVSGEPMLPDAEPGFERLMEL